MPIEILAAIVLVTLRDRKAGLGLLSYMLREGEYGKRKVVANKVANAIDKVISKL